MNLQKTTKTKTPTYSISNFLCLGYRIHSLTFTVLFAIVISLVVFSLFLASPMYAQAGGVTLTVTILGDKQCNDGVDNDGDGETDYPADDGCSSATDDDETDSSSDPGDDDSDGSSGGGGGGSSGGGIVSPSTMVIFKGKAYPSSDITLLKDAQVVATTKAGSDANFEIRISDISAGTYVFGVWGEDTKGRRSITHTFTISITGGVTTSVSGIFLPPTIFVDKVEVRRGESLNILGSSVPNADVTVFVNSKEELVKKISADAAGAWLYQLDTLEVDYGEHTTRSRAARDDEITTFSNVVSFLVGTKSVKRQLPKKIGKGDMNGDGKVNLVDFSIAAFWYKRPSPPSSADFNGDGKVNLIDFSIMAFYWTG